MPELPEVETVARDLRPLLLGRRIENVRCGSRRLRFPWRRSWNPKVVGRRIDNVARRGKWLLFQFDDDSFLLGHLGMTGQMRVVFMNDPGETHTHLIFSLDDRMEWRYRDVRRFGGLQRFSSEADIDKALAERLGPEPWALEPDRWFQDLARSRRNLKGAFIHIFCFGDLIPTVLPAANILLEIASELFDRQERLGKTYAKTAIGHR